MFVALRGYHRWSSRLGFSVVFGSFVCVRVRVCVCVRVCVAFVRRPQPFSMFGTCFACIGMLRVHCWRHCCNGVWRFVSCWWSCCHVLTSLFVRLVGEAGDGERLFLQTFDATTQPTIPGHKRGACILMSVPVGAGAGMCVVGGSHVALDQTVAGQESFVVLTSMAWTNCRPPFSTCCENRCGVDGDADKHVHTDTHTYIYIYIYIYREICIYMYIYVYVYSYICAFICLYTCVCICIHIYIYIYIYIYMCVCVYIHTHIYVYIYIYICVCVCAAAQ